MLTTFKQPGARRQAIKAGNSLQVPIEDAGSI
jgi:hypothetical protein